MNAIAIAIAIYHGKPASAFYKPLEVGVAFNFQSQDCYPTILSVLKITDMFTQTYVHTTTFKSYP